MPSSTPPQPDEIVPAAAPRKKILVLLSFEGPESACPYIRFITPFSMLEDRWELVWGLMNNNLNLTKIKSADLVVLHRSTPGMFSMDSLKLIFGQGTPVVYETDDLLHQLPDYHPEHTPGQQLIAGIEYAARHAVAIVTSMPFLAEKLRLLNPEVVVLPNYIDFDLFYRPVPLPTPASTPAAHPAQRSLHIGLLGTSLQGPNFRLVDRALRILCDRYPGRIKLFFVGRAVPPGWEAHPATVFISVIASYRAYATLLKKLAWDIALVPLADDDFNYSKTAIKWLEYSACGIASAFSDVSVYRAAVTEAKTGLLVKNATQAWVDAVESLIGDSALRHRLATAAQDEVRAGYAIRDNACAYDTVYSKWATSAYRSVAASTGETPDLSAGGSLQKKKCVVIYSIDPVTSARAQIRFILPFGFLGSEWEVVWGIADGKLDAATLDRADLIVLHRFMPGLLEIRDLEIIFGKCKPVIYETDELLNDLPDYHRLATDSKRWKRGIEYAAERAQAIIVSNPFLAGRYRHLNNHVCVLADYVDYGRFYRPVAPPTKKGITIGLLGSALQAPNFGLVEAALRDVCSRHEGRIRLYFVGSAMPDGWRDHAAVTFVPTLDAYCAYAAHLLDMAWDIALVPLVGDEFNHGTHPVKWQEYAAAGIAAIFSGSAMFRDVVTDGVTGVLVADGLNPDHADSGAAAWSAAIASLIDTPALRYAIASAAQSVVAAEHDLRDKAQLYNEVYGAVARGDNTLLALAAQRALSLQQSVTGLAPAAPGLMRGVLVRDPDGAHERIQGSLNALRNSDMGRHGDLVVVVLTTAAGMTPAWTHHLRYLQATPAEYAQALVHVTALPDFEWVRTVDV